MRKDTSRAEVIGKLATNLSTLKASIEKTKTSTDTNKQASHKQKKRKTSAAATNGETDIAQVSEEAVCLVEKLEEIEPNSAKYPLYLSQILKELNAQFLLLEDELSEEQETRQPALLEIAEQYVTQTEKYFETLQNALQERAALEARIKSLQEEKTKTDASLAHSAQKIRQNTGAQERKNAALLARIEALENENAALKASQAQRPSLQEANLKQLEADWEKQKNQKTKRQERIKAIGLQGAREKAKKDQETIKQLEKKIAAQGETIDDLIHELEQKAAFLEDMRASLAKMEPPMSNEEFQKALKEIDAVFTPESTSKVVLSHLDKSSLNLSTPKTGQIDRALQSPALTPLHQKRKSPSPATPAAAPFSPRPKQSKIPTLRQTPGSQSGYRIVKTPETPASGENGIPVFSPPSAASRYRITTTTPGTPASGKSSIPVFSPRAPKTK